MATPEVSSCRVCGEFGDHAHTRRRTRVGGDDDGDGWIPWTPPKTGTGPRDPISTPLSAFPKMPVLFLQPGEFGPTPVRKHIEEKHVLANPIWLGKRELIARAWIEIARQWLPDRASSRAWLARLEREFGAHSLQGKCYANCEPKYVQLYLIANAAQYLAGMWSHGKATPPTLPPDRSILAQMGDWAGEQVGDALFSKLGIIAGIGLAGFVAFKVATRPPRR